MLMLCCNVNVISLILFLFCSTKGQVNDWRNNELIETQIYEITTGVARIDGTLQNKIPFDSSKIKYYLYRTADSFDEFDCSYNTLSSNETHRIVFIIHGWLSSRKSEWYTNLTDAFFNLSEPLYVMQVDWSFYSFDDYVLASNYTNDIGVSIANCIAHLHTQNDIPLSRFLIVGHSLGAQIAGFVGKSIKNTLNKSLSRLVGLDPAGPLFQNRPQYGKLCKTDATTVEVVHTNGGVFGYLFPCGSLDFFVNGGTFQPGCLQNVNATIANLDAISCSHHRAIDLFIEGLGHPDRFVGTPMSLDVLNIRSPRPAIGDLETTAVGNYAVTTSDEPPYYL